MRIDFLEKVAEDQRFMADLMPGLRYLTRLSTAGLKDALIGPARLVSYEFESDGLVDEIVEQLTLTDGALPILQSVASIMWENRDRKNKIFTRRAYEDIGGIAGALAKHADTQFKSLPVKYHSTAKDIFLRLTTSIGTRDLAAMEELYLLGEHKDVKTTVEHFVQARLLLISRGKAGTSATVEIAHEALIHGWDMLRGWLEMERANKRFLEHLREQARRWFDEGQPDDLLWKGKRVRAVRQWQKQSSLKLTDTEKEYLKNVFVAAKRVRRTRTMMGFLGASITLVLVVAAGFLFMELKSSEGNRERVETDLGVTTQELQRKSGELDTATQELAQSNRELADANKELRVSLEKEKHAAVRERQLKVQAQAAQLDAFSARDEAMQRRDEALAATEKEREARFKAERAKQEAERAKQEAERAKQEAERARQEAERLRRISDAEKQKIEQQKRALEDKIKKARARGLDDGELE